MVDIGTRITEHLRKVLPPEEAHNIVVEKCADNEIIIGYCGSKSLKKFKKEYEETVTSHISFIAGYENKIKFKQRKAKKEKVEKTNFDEIKFETEPLPKTETVKDVEKTKKYGVIKWFALSCVFIAIALVIALVVGNYVVNRNFKENFYNVSSLKVNNTLRILQISDLHSCEYGQDNAKLIDRVTKLKPDIIIYTGDCLDSGAGSTESITALCKELAKVAPSYYIYGNNEVERYYNSALTQVELDEKFGFNDETRDPEKLREITDDFEKELEASGVKVLKNEQDTVVVGTTKVDIYGVLTSNPSSFWSYAGDTYNRFLYENTENLKVMAIHEPFVFSEYETETWGDIAICGHTHGGIARIPMIGALYTHEGGFLPEREGDYVYGRYEVEGRPLIVSSGLVNSDLLRINNQPEIVIVDINKF